MEVSKNKMVDHMYRHFLQVSKANNNIHVDNAYTMYILELGMIVILFWNPTIHSNLLKILLPLPNVKVVALSNWDLSLHLLF